MSATPGSRAPAGPSGHEPTPAPGASGTDHESILAADPALGLAALHSPTDPTASLRISDGAVVELDGRAREDFDVVDAYIADHGLDLEVAPEAMQIPDAVAARMILDPAVPRTDVVAMAAGMTPAKLAAVVRHLRPAELAMALTTMRSRRSPAAGALVTNRLDDPLLLAADAATAVAFGFREVTTTGTVPRDAPSNALALLVGSQVGRAGALGQCQVDTATQVRLGVRGLASSAEGVRLGGTEEHLADLDETPWSAAFLVAAYASRGMKSRVGSGAAASALQGTSQGYSMLYLESRAVALARACGTQGVRNGGGDAAGLAATLPSGLLELQYENLLSMLRGLETCSDAGGLVSGSPARRFSRNLPTLLAGADTVGGIATVPEYDNLFGPANLGRDQLDDLVLLQRDWGVDLGLRHPSDEEVRQVRRQAVEACRAVYSWLGLADFSDEHADAAVNADSSRDLPQDIGLAVLAAAQTIDQQAISGLDVAVALEETGFSDEAEALLALLRERVRGDYLQTAALFDPDLDENGPGGMPELRCRSAVTDPNDHTGPGSGYVPDDERRHQINTVRQQRTTIDIREDQSQGVRLDATRPLGPAPRSDDPRDVVVGVSPAFGSGIWLTLADLPAIDVLDELLAGLEEEGCLGRVVRVREATDLGRIGYAAAALSGSGIGISLQGTGAVRVTRRGMPPAESLESLTDAAALTAQAYRRLAVNAARHAKGSVPEPIRLTGRAGQGTGHQARTVAYLALEGEQLAPGAPAELLEVQRD